MPPPNGALNVRVCIGYKNAAPTALRLPKTRSAPWWTTLETVSGEPDSSHRLAGHRGVTRGIQTLRERLS